MGIPQIIIICLLATALGIALAKHGEPKEGYYSFWVQLLSVAIDVGLLWWGGFFD